MFLDEAKNLKIVYIKASINNNSRMCIFQDTVKDVKIQNNILYLAFRIGITIEIIKVVIIFMIVFV